MFPAEDSHKNGYLPTADAVLLALVGLVCGVLGESAVVVFFPAMNFLQHPDVFADNPERLVADVPVHILEGSAHNTR